MSNYPFNNPSFNMSEDIWTSGDYTPFSICRRIIDNHTPVNKNGMINSVGYEISAIQNFVNNKFLGRSGIPVESGFITKLTSINGGIYLENSIDYLYNTIIPDKITIERNQPDLQESSIISYNYFEINNYDITQELSKSINLDVDKIKFEKSGPSLESSFSIGIDGINYIENFNNGYTHSWNTTSSGMTWNFNQEDPLISRSTTLECVSGLYINISGGLVVTGGAALSGGLWVGIQTGGFLFTGNNGYTDEIISKGNQCFIECQPNEGSAGSAMIVLDNTIGNQGGHCLIDSDFTKVLSSLQVAGNLDESLQTGDFVAYSGKFKTALSIEDTSGEKCLTLSGDGSNNVQFISWAGVDFYTGGEGVIENNKLAMHLDSNGMMSCNSGELKNIIIMDETTYDQILTISGDGSNNCLFKNIFNQGIEFYTGDNVESANFRIDGGGEIVCHSGVLINSYITSNDSGVVPIGTTDYPFGNIFSTGLFIQDIVSYASNAAALGAGEPIGRVYRNGDNLCIVH